MLFPPPAVAGQISAPFGANSESENNGKTHLNSPQEPHSYTQLLSRHRRRPPNSTDVSRVHRGSPGGEFAGDGV